ncbi:MAG: hypothetical protein ABIO44_08500 [Saprospiraceae bacterium]
MLILIAINIIIYSWFEKPPQLSGIQCTNSIERSNHGIKISASSKTIYLNEKIELTFSLPHGECLGIIDPAGNFFYVIYPVQFRRGNLYPFITSKQFIKCDKLTLNTSTLKCDPYTYQIFENQIVFKKTGTYKFLLGDNLHVDDEDFLDILKIDYYNYARPNYALK